MKRRETSYVEGSLIKINKKKNKCEREKAYLLTGDVEHVPGPSLGTVNRTATYVLALHILILVIVILLPDIIVKRCRLRNTKECSREKQK